MNALLGLRGTAAVCAAAVLLTACSGAHGKSGGTGGTGGAGGGAGAAAATQSVAPWWSAKDSYCTMLSDTVKAGSIVPNGSGGIATSELQAFVTDVQHAAPAAIAQDWKVLGAALVAFSASGGRPASTDSATAVAAAATEISADAKANCNLTLSLTATPAPKPPVHS